MWSESYSFSLPQLFLSQLFGTGVTNRMLLREGRTSSLENLKQTAMISLSGINSRWSCPPCICYQPMRIREGQENHLWKQITWGLPWASVSSGAKIGVLQQQAREALLCLLFVPWDTCIILLFNLGGRCVWHVWEGFCRGNNHKGSFSLRELFVVWLVTPWAQGEDRLQCWWEHQCGCDKTQICLTR